MTLPRIEPRSSIPFNVQSTQISDEKKVFISSGICQYYRGMNCLDANEKH